MLMLNKNKFKPKTLYINIKINKLVKSNLLKRGKMNKKYYVFVLLVISIFLLSACKGKSGAAAGTAPKIPFIGGTAGISMNFEKDNPPPEVTDDASFAFKTIVRLKNEGEFKVDKQDIKLNLIGFDPNDFGRTFSDLRDVTPEDTLDSKKRDAEGNIVEGTTTFATFPKGSGDFIPTKFTGNTEFTFRAETCYNYETRAETKLCVLRDMINVRDGSLCNPNGAKTIHSSAAPVQVSNFRQSIVGKDKLSFSFDVSVSGNVDIFSDRNKPSSNFDNACPKDPRTRREVENRVTIEITEVPSDPIVGGGGLKCGGLDNSNKGEVILVGGRRTITCTVDLVTDRVDLEKVMGVKVTYNVLDNKETKILVKHLAES